MQQDKSTLKIDAAYLYTAPASQFPQKLVKAVFIAQKCRILVLLLTQEAN
jgi:hypothetical protein